MKHTLIAAFMTAGLSIGAIEVSDLPAFCQSTPRNSLRPVDEIERDAIVTALREAGGNRRCRRAAARFAIHVRAHVPRVGLRHQGGACHLLMVSDPGFLPLVGRLDHRLTLLAQVPNGISDPLRLLLQAGGHVAQRRRWGQRHRGAV